jgi:hypothetical protein
MYSTDKNHISAYKSWVGIKEGQKPNIGNNIRFFISYQFGHMYLRYFMWNFAGKQNDIQSHGSLVNGNWISGLRFVDISDWGIRTYYPINIRTRNPEISIIYYH